MRPTQHHDADTPTAGEIAGELSGLMGGLSVLLLPLSVITLPGLILFFVAPVVLLALVVAVPLAIAAVIAAPPYLVVRAVRRRRAVSQPELLACLWGNTPRTMESR
jgi:Flp pilus assembly protein TadB